MPKRKKKASTLKQKQSQRQSVVVNIGTTKKSKPRKKSGRGSLPPPSYQHNLAPTFVTNQQIDYTPLISSILHATNKIGEANTLSQQTIQNPITPLSSVSQSSAQMVREMAGVKAEERRAGQTADNFQPLPSQADERYAQEVQVSFDEEDRRAFKAKDFSGGGGNVPEAFATPVGEVTSSQEIPLTKKQRKKRTTKVEMERRRAEEVGVPAGQTLMDSFVTPKPKTGELTPKK